MRPKGIRIMNQHLDKKTIELLIKSGVLTKDDLKKINYQPQDKVLLHEVYDSWKSFISNHLSEATASGYLTNVARFIEWYLDASNIFTLPQDTAVPMIENKDVEKWLKHLSNNGYEYSSIRRYKYSLKSFYDYIAEQYKIKAPNIANIPIPAESADIDALRDDEIVSIAEYADNIRNKALIMFMYETGMRRQEVIECKKEDVNYDTKRVPVKQPGNARVCYFTDRSKMLLIKHIAEWDEEVKDINKRRYDKSRTSGEPYNPVIVSEYLFQTVRSAKISYSTIFKALKDASYNYYLALYKKDGVKNAKELAKEMSEKINTETLRHSRRAYWFAQGKTVEQVQAIMGDENRWVCNRHHKVAQMLYPEAFVK